MRRIVGNIFRVLESAFREKMDGFTKCSACSGHGVTPNGRCSVSKNCHSSNGQCCWFCEGHGVLPLSGLRGFQLVRTVSNLQTHNLPRARIEGFFSIALLSNSTIQKIDDCMSIKFRSCLGTKPYLFHTFKYPTWLADARADVVSQARHANAKESQLLRHHMFYGSFHSAVLLITLLSSAISSHCADAHAISSNYSPNTERTENENNELDKSAATYKYGKESCGYRKPRRCTRKCRNRLREKAVEDAEMRARCILMALIPRETTNTGS